MSNFISLSQLGWRPFFQQQLTLEEWETVRIARVMEHHRTGFSLALAQDATEKHTVNLAINSSTSDIAVGDWLLLDDQNQMLRQLDRISEFSRKAAGTKIQRQMIAANVDTVFIVSSLNDDFNLSRIERYLTLAHQAGVEPVVVLSKADCCDDPHKTIQQVRALDPMLMVEAVNGLDNDSVAILQSWCSTGQTIAFLGSSGVGKSTLINTLLGTEVQLTAGIRKDDAKGRHTTTGRAMTLMPAGALLLDTPGMRELQLADCEQGIEETFSDITALAKQCRFSDCQHISEPNCAVLGALQSGDLEARRLSSFQKLKREQFQNTASLAEKRSRDRSLTKMYSSHQSEARRRKKGEK